MKQLNYFLSFLIFIFIIFSCCDSKQKNPIFDEKMIKIISENPIYLYSTDVPPKYAFTTFFVQGDSGKILILDPRELEEIYDEDYPSWNYKKYVRSALNQKLVIKAKNKRESFGLDKEVTDNYLNNGFTDFRIMYCDKITEDDRCWLRNDILEHQLYSILYYFFINNYLAHFDDVLGSYSVEKISRFIDAPARRSVSLRRDRSEAPASQNEINEVYKTKNE